MEGKGSRDHKAFGPQHVFIDYIENAGCGVQMPFHGKPALGLERTTF
jgi:hypothetical protein